jgi:hypothetical protein
MLRNVLWGCVFLLFPLSTSAAARHVGLRTGELGGPPVHVNAFANANMKRISLQS